MRRGWLIGWLVLAILACAAWQQSGVPMMGSTTTPAAGGIWTMIQHVTVAQASCAASTCTATLTSTGAGNLLVASASYNTGINSIRTITGVTSADCVASWQLPAGTQGFDATTFNGVDIAYCLNSASGKTTLVVTMNAGTGNLSIEAIEYHWSASTIALDGTPANAVNTASASPPCVAQTLTHTSDVVFQVIKGNRTVTAISGSYTNPADFDSTNNAGFSGWINVATTSPTTCTWTTGISDVSTVAATSFAGS